ncbi:SnoaL-like domain-containing protein [Lipomyces kononenkoae]|uniref:SnoaL-like domain-containing protein n=1 Tax=Lipomyces kononenkoae TaxID=34357 RepID=A0ACC3SPZ4_LIPKO
MTHSSGSLTGLTTREAIADALYRGVLGLDTNDFAMFKSALVEGKDTCFDLNGTILNGMDEINYKIFNFIGPLDTTHTVSNIRVDVKDGEDTASMTAYAVAQHYKPGEGCAPAARRLLTGGLYFIDLVRDSSDALWKIRKWTLKSIVTR